MDTMTSLKISDSAAKDSMSSLLFRQVANLLLCPIFYIVNFTFEQGVFPESIKSDIIKPLHKRSNVIDQNNYRPIFITSTFSKVKKIPNRLYPLTIEKMVEKI